MNKELLYSAVRTAIVAKISLNAFMDKKLAKLGFYPNQYDSFNITEEFSNNLETYFRLPESYKISKNIKTEILKVKPKAGDKLIGDARDKGTISTVLKKFVPFIQFKFSSKIKATRFKKFIKDIDKEIFFETDKSFEVIADVIAHDSTARDNVGALVLNSCLEFDSILSGKEINLSVNDILEIDIVEKAKKTNSVFNVVVRDKDLNIVHEFGECPILIEDFFWHPQHGNRFCIKEKEISLMYNQSKDAMKILTPTLNKIIENCFNFNSIKEDMLLLGLEIGNPTEYETINDIETINSSSNKFFDEEL